MIREIDGGVTAPQGWRASGIASGIKPSGKPDLALIISDVPAKAAGVFTTNLVRAACVDYNEALVQAGQPVQAIVINAGNANAATGIQGVLAVEETAQIFAEILAIQPQAILTASTGVIGVPLPVEKIRQAVPSLVNQVSTSGSAACAEAILTTDLVVKSLALTCEINGIPIRLGAIAKGSGMIHPNMATLLCFVTTDAQVEATLWQQLLKQAVDLSFNQITVDGDTSTNDMVLALANGQAGNPEISDPHSLAAQQLSAMLTRVCQYLAQRIARDGEGATKLLEVQVTGAGTDAAARQVALTVAGSNLFKCALFGNDPNWGRIAAAAGRAGVKFNPQQLAIWVGEIQLMAQGQPLGFDRVAASTYLKSDPVIVRLDLGQAAGEGIAWGCDLTYDYVRINGEYTT